MDLKIDGLTPAIIKEALQKTHEARIHILDEVMLKAIPEPRAELSTYAPKMLTTSVNPEKIGDIIGKSGKVIKEIQGSCNVDVNIEEDGQVFIAGLDIENCRRALMMIETIANDPEIGSVYKGKVTRLMSFGAFVEIAPGKEGLVHISHLDVRRVESVESVVQVGDEIIVQVLEIDDQGRINLSRRNALIEIEGAVPENEVSDVTRRPPARRDHGDRDRRRRR
jgi:polyribonucleotide nucleotidyltransferase